MGWEVRITSDPLCMRERGESDHAPVVAKARVRGRRAPEARPILPRVEKTQGFKSLLQKFVAASDMAALDVFERLREFKRLAHEVARVVMRDQARSCSDGDVTAQLIRTASRAVAQQDVFLARRLVREHPEVAEHSSVGRGAVGLKDACAFAQHLGTLQCAHLECARAEKDQARVKRGSSGVGRLVKLWTPFDKRLILRGVRVPGSHFGSRRHMSAWCHLGSHL